MGLFYRHGQTGTATLAGVPTHDITTTVNSHGATITSYLVPCDFLPLTQPLLDLGVSAATVDKLNAVLRPVIDAGYSRNDPPATATPPAQTVDTARTETTIKASVAEAAISDPATPARTSPALARPGTTRLHHDSATNSPPAVRPAPGVRRNHH